MNLHVLRCLALVGAACALGACSSPEAVPAQQPAPPRSPAPEGVVNEFRSAYLASPLMIFADVFPPTEAEAWVLPFMHDHPQLFAGKRVFDIGTGSGIISLYAAQLGASSVVCTDISEDALRSVRNNAERMGFADIIDARLVPLSDMSAYSAVADDEVFDTIISNPPYSLDLDSSINTPVVDKGDLGFSIVRGFERHLAQDGIAALFYNSLFYHLVMVKFARYEGYDVRTQLPLGLSPHSLNALFNTYLQRMLITEDLPADAFRFERSELPYALVEDTGEHVPLIGDSEPTGNTYRGFMVIRR